MTGKENFQKENVLLEICLSDEFVKKLEDCAAALNLSKTQVARMGIELVTKEIQKN